MTGQMRWVENCLGFRDLDAEVTSYGSLYHYKDCQVLGGMLLGQVAPLSSTESVILKLASSMLYKCKMLIALPLARSNLKRDAMIASITRPLRDLL